MLLGVIFGRKTYTLQKVMLVLTIVAGVILFIFKDQYEEKDGEDPWLGNSLIAVSLLMDGFTGASEDRMRSVTKPTPLNFMHFVNLWSSGILIIGLFVFGEIPKFIDFVTKHPQILQYLGLAVLVFISSMVAHFGPLPLSITTTTRKFFSVFLSVILFNNTLSFRQWCAAALIFGALFLDAILNKKTKVKAKTETELQTKVESQDIEISVIQEPNETKTNEK